MINEVKLYADTMLYLETNKIVPATEDKYTKRNKILSPFDVATDYVKEYNLQEHHSKILEIVTSHCRTYAKRREQLVIEAPPLNLFSTEAANRRYQQVFFCDSPRNKGYVLQKSKDDWEVSDKPCSVEVFRKELNLLGEEAFKKWYSENLIVGMYDYRPWRDTLEKNKEKVYVLNTYKRPDWFRRINKRTWEELDPKLRCFYEHLFPIQEQREYALNWVRCTVMSTFLKRKKPKISTYLTLIGASGVGKGVFCEYHMSYLHGRSNFHQLNVGKVSDKFTTSSFAKKTLVVFNEASIKDEQSYDIIKSLESVQQDVEYKNETATMEATYFNIMWCCNHKDKMRYLSQDDRRFSILDIATEGIVNKNMKDSVTGQNILFTREVMDELCNNEELLLQLAEYVLNGEADFSAAENPFKGSLNEAQIRHDSRPAWCQELLDCFMNVDWDSPGGTETRIGYEEIEGSKYPHFTYSIPSKTIERVMDKVTKSRKSISIPWTAFKEEFKKLNQEEVYVFQEPNGVRRYAVRVRHPMHDEILQKHSDKIVTP